MRVVASAAGYRNSETTQSFTTLQEQLLVENLQATAIEAQVRVGWMADDRAMEYVVTVYEQQGETSIEFAMSTELDNEYEFTGDPVTGYTITVVAQGDDYRDSEPAQVEAMTERVVLSAVPSTAVMVSATNNSVSVNWEANIDARITNYVLSIRPDTDNAGETVVDASQAGSHTFTNLLQNTPYEVMLRSSGDSTLYISNMERSVHIVSIGTGIKLPTPNITDIAEDATTVLVTWDPGSVGGFNCVCIEYKWKRRYNDCACKLGYL